MKVALISANQGNFDPEFSWAEQVLPPEIQLDIFRLNETNFPLRQKAMTSRLQPGIAKMLGWQLFPEYDFYVWVDASRTISSDRFVGWMLTQCGSADMGLFRHPHRRTIKEEYDFIQEKMAKKSRYLLSRYEGEWIKDQYELISKDSEYRDTILYASTGLVYRPTLKTQTAMKEWWYHKTRYFIHDQLALPYVTWQSGCKINIIEQDIYKLPYWEFTRKR